MDHYIVDGMKKEGKYWKILMLFAYALAALTLLAFFLIDNPYYTYKDYMVRTIACLFFGSFGLYGWLYAVKYKLEITNEKIHIKTLFSKLEVSIQEIKGYTCKRYKKSAFYQFRLSVNGRVVLVNTRYKEEFLRILNENGIADLEKL